MQLKYASGIFRTSLVIEKILKGAIDCIVKVKCPYCKTNGLESNVSVFLVIYGL